MSDTISVQEAARRAGCAPSTIRRWLAGGDLKGAKGDKGWQVDLDSLLAHLAVQEPSVGALRAGASAAAHSASDHDRLISILEEALRIERQRNERLEARNIELETELRTMSRELKALLEGNSEGKLSRWIKGIVK